MKTDKHSQEYLDNLRHSTAHLLAAAIEELYPNALRTIGPAIENGFYFDFDNLKISGEDFEKIEQKMREILPTWEGFDVTEVSYQSARDDFASNPYKLELIEQYKDHLTYAKSGSYFDLCRGGHVENPQEELKHFKLLSVAGAYWRGDEKNKMLTRIYGTAFPTQKELDQHLQMLTESEKRNHKKLGQELELFIFHETAPGMAYFLPKGVMLYNELINFWKVEHKAAGYQEIFSPLINKKELYETSGHWEHYLDDMFISETEEGEVYALKPMNCPNAMVVFGSKTRSYRDLPLRLSDTDCLHRFERSGTLNGLLRVREFRQDDAHIFVTDEQIRSEFKSLFELTERFYSIFGLSYKFRLGTMPESHIGEVEMWDKATATLKEVLEESQKEYFIEEGDGAFYGPKIDILMKDGLGREWQMGTLQLDFQLPSRFKLKYSAEDGTQQVPVVIHRVIYGSLERFIGILVEHFEGKFPLWLSPIQVKILPITDKTIDYAAEVSSKLEENNMRVEIDDRSETLQAKIRDAQLEKVPYMVILGDKEEEAKVISVRNRSGENKNNVNLDEFVDEILDKVKSKSLEL